jgi:hypothetical protein
MNGSCSFEAALNVPQMIPSGTPKSDDSRKPQKITCALCQRLSCSHGSVGKRGGVVNAVTSAVATSCGAGK